LVDGKEHFGVGKNQINVDEYGRRFSSADAFLSPSLLASRANLHVRANAHVAKVIFEGKRAVGVVYHDKVTNRKIEVRADREVILAAGAIQSPQLLMLSGVGPANHLQEHDIHVVHDLPGVGANLQDHVVGGFIYNISIKQSFLEKTKDFVEHALSLHSEESLYNFAQWLLMGKGPFVSNAAELNAYVRTPVAVARNEIEPDMQLIALPGMTMEHGFRKFQPDHKDGFTFGAVLLNPASVGYIKLRSNNSFDQPIIQPNYFEKEVDLERFFEVYKLLRKSILSSKVLNDKYDLHEVQPGAHITENNFKEFIKSTIETLYHPVGTCKMGKTDDEMAVVDKDLRVIGVEGLRVIDASVMPVIPRANTQAPTIMIAEKGADLIKQSL
jgi:choline dehydrogenase